MTCSHTEHAATVSIVDIGGQQAAVVRIQCAACGWRFRFKGATPGKGINHPRVSPDMTAMCLPIEPMPEFEAAP